MRYWMRLLLFFAAVLLLVLGAGGVIVADRAADRFIHPGRVVPTTTPDDFDLTVWEDVTFQSSDGLELHGYFVPGSPEADGATVILVHGFGGNRTWLLPQAALLHDHGYNAFTIELRHHGTSEGTKSTLGLDEVNDVRGAIDYLLTRSDVNPDRIAITGESLGAATSIRAGALFPELRAVVAQAPFSSLEDNVNEGVRQITGLPPFPFAPLVLWRAEVKAGYSASAMRPVDEIGLISPRPVLLMHGTEDRLLHFSNSERLLAAAGEPKRLVLFEGAQHAGLLAADPVLFEREFFGFLDPVLLPEGVVESD